MIARVSTLLWSCAWLLGLAAGVAAQPDAPAEPGDSAAPVAADAVPAPGSDPAPAPEPAQAVDAATVDGDAPADAAATAPVEAVELDAAAAAEADAGSAFDEPIDEGQLAAILADEGENAGPSLNLYGFMDFTYQDLLMPEDSPFYLFFEENGSFWVGNLNLYIDGRISERFRTLAEVRFLYLPNGGPDDLTPEDAPRTSTSSQDYADVNRSLDWGGVEIERAWLEYFVNQYLTVRAGQYLTPYGIWNVDHGSPVVVGTRRPYIVGQQLFPERQTGLKAYGLLALNELTLRYHLTLSNGRGPSDAYRDLDANKGIGGRLELSYNGFGRLTVGGSVYRARYTDRTDEASLGAGMKVVRTQTVRAQYDELAVGADIKWQWQGLLLQGEWVYNERAYTEEGRPSLMADAILGPSQPSFQPDNTQWGLYGLIGYRIASLRLMPYFYGEYVDLANGQVLPDVATWQAGLNFQPEPAVVVKVQYTHAWSPGSTAVFDGQSIRAVEAQLAWAF